jgi:hypothetical protein
MSASFRTHYEAAVLMKDAARQKAERILIRELRVAGLTKKGITGAPAKRATQIEDRHHSYGNRNAPRMDRPTTRPSVGVEGVP